MLHCVRKENDWNKFASSLIRNDRDIHLVRGAIFQLANPFCLKEGCDYAVNWSRDP